MSFPNNAEEFPSTSFTPPGDFYREEEPCRGVCLAGPADGGGFSGHFDESFYNVPQLRDPDANFGPGAFSVPSCFGGQLGGLDAGYGDGTYTKPNYLGANLGSEYAGGGRFSPSHTPPIKPSNYRLSPMTRHLETNKKFAAYPSDHMNAVLDVLGLQQDGLKANVKSTDLVRYALEATVFVNHKMCEVRASLFHEVGDKYTLEFTKLDGDSFSFQDFVNLATKALKDKRMLDPTREPVVKPSMAPPPMDFLDDFADEFSLDCGGEPMIGPLLDMAKMKDFPSEQAEAAAGLAEAVSDRVTGPRAAEALCDQLEAVMDIMECKLETAGYQAARLVGALMQHETATRLLMRQDIAEKIADKILTDESKLVRSEFKQVAELISEKHSQGMSQEVKDLFDRASRVAAKTGGVLPTLGAPTGKVVDFQGAPPLPAMHSLC